MKQAITTFTVCLIAIFVALPTQAENTGDEHDNKRKHHQGAKFVFKSALSGAQEVPENDSEAKGRIRVRFAPDLSKIHVRLKLTGINSMVVAGHLHCARAGENGPVAVGLLAPGPLTEIGELTRVTLTNADFTGADCGPTAGRPVNNIAALYFAMREGSIYLNLHTPDYPPGELRGQLLPAHP